MYLIVGLGNPGKEYEKTRHNIGFEAIDLLAKRNKIALNKMKFKSIYGEGRIGPEKVYLMKPTTYMNNSGEAVKAFADYYKIGPENILVIVDDIDIPFSSIRIKKNGSAGSHNGLKSIVKLLGSKNFSRLKLGVGQKNENQDLASFVLGRFSKEEMVDIDKTLDLSVRAIEEAIRSGIESSMNKFNNKDSSAQA